MRLSKPIDFQNVGALSRALRAEKGSRERFSLELPVNDCANAILAAMRVEVEYRGGRFRCDEDTQSHILQAAGWLTDANSSPGLLLCGLYGNGKTTLANAIARIIGHLSEREMGYASRINTRFLTAKDICRMCAASERFQERYDEYTRIFTEPSLIIDDLGEEPKEVMVYGMLHTPIIDLISKRYASQKMTIITTNLDAGELKAKYTERIYDRLAEMVTSIVFENDSYRPRKTDH